MVEFRFDIKGLFPQPIVRVTSNLLPHTFHGDRRQALDTTSKMSEIIDRLGQLSAVSQKLAKPVTTAQKLRMSDNQVIYLMAEPNAGHNGIVIGLLKVGTKDLYLFDEIGQTRKVEKTPCILDFYIHESRQRAGLGKELFETMLSEEQWTPVKCSVDRPSEKLLGFLKKHYGLVRIIPQANNFVVYEGFFESVGKQGHQANGGMHITNSPNTQLFGAHYQGEEVDRRRLRQLDASKSATLIPQISPAGRYGARRPTCSMAEGRKNPLDALSRTSVRLQTIEKRSGLQDVDEEYLKRNVFSNSSYLRRSGLENYNMRGQMQDPAMAMSQVPMSQMQDQAQKMQVAPNSAAMTPSEAQFQGQQQQQQQQQMQMQMRAHVHPHAHNQMQGQNPVADQKSMHGQTPDQVQQQIPPQQMQQFQMATPEMQGKNQSYKESHIIHNSPANTGGTESSSDNQSPTHHPSIIEAVDALASDLQDLQTAVAEQISSDVADAAEVAIEQEAKEIITLSPSGENAQSQSPLAAGLESFMSVKTFQLSKQHTGMKNTSFGVGNAVTPNNTMDFHQKDHDDFGSSKAHLNANKTDSSQPHDNDNMSTVSSAEGYTDQGFHDLKFYHNKLW